jgi:hypothetical protein
MCIHSRCWLPYTIFHSSCEYYPQALGPQNWATNIVVCCTPIDVDQSRKFNMMNRHKPFQINLFFGLPSQAITNPHTWETQLLRLLNYGHEKTLRFLDVGSFGLGINSINNVKNFFYISHGGRFAIMTNIGHMDHLLLLQEEGLIPYATTSSGTYLNMESTCCQARETPKFLIAWSSFLLSSPPY